MLPVHAVKRSHSSEQCSIILPMMFKEIQHDLFNVHDVYHVYFEFDMPSMWVCMSGVGNLCYYWPCNVLRWSQSSGELWRLLPDVPYRVACESLSIPLLNDCCKLCCFKLFDAMNMMKIMRNPVWLTPSKPQNCVQSAPKNSTVPFTKSATQIIIK